MPGVNGTMNVDNVGSANVKLSVIGIRSLDGLRQRRRIKLNSIYVTALFDEEIYIETIAKYRLCSIVGGLVEAKFRASLICPLSS